MRRCRRHLSHARLVEQAVDDAQTEELARRRVWLVRVSFMRSCSAAGRVSSARRADRPAVSTLPVTVAVVRTTSRPTSRLSSASIRA